MTDNANPAPTVPWIPGMRATDEEGHAWRFTTAGVWWPDEGHTKAAPMGALTADFSDMATGTAVDWLLKQARDANAREDVRRAEAAADPSHPDNVAAFLNRAAVDGDKP